MFENAVNYSVTDFCKDLLKKRFANEPSVKQEVHESDDKLNFACPYCGDSEKDPNKKRGNLFLTTNTYKCFNDGCFVWVPVEKFISNFALKYKLAIPGVGERKIEFKPSTSLKKRGFLIEFLINQEIGKKLLVFSELVDRFSLIPCHSAEPDSPIGKFIEKRKINHLPVFEQSCYYDAQQDKIYIFNLDLKSGRVLGFAIRRIDDSYPGPKYDIKNYAFFKKTGLIKDLDDEFITEVNTINNYFNILNIDFSSKVTITEGQIDSMFVTNCFASTGVTKARQVLGSIVTKKNARILFDADKAGKNEALELIKEGYSVFLWSKVFQDLKKKYQSDHRKIRDIKDVNDLFRFLLYKDDTLSFIAFNHFLNNYFSDSVFDMLSV